MHVHTCMCMLIIFFPVRELNLSGSCVPLAELLSSTVCKAVQLFNMKCEQLVSQWMLDYILHVIVHFSLPPSLPPSPSVLRLLLERWLCRCQVHQIPLSNETLPLLISYTSLRHCHTRYSNSICMKELLLLLLIFVCVCVCSISSILLLCLR